MGHITTTFLRGLSAVLPAALTVWIVIWLARTTEALLKDEPIDRRLQAALRAEGVHVTGP